MVSQITGLLILVLKSWIKFFAHAESYAYINENWSSLCPEQPLMQILLWRKFKGQLWAVSWCVGVTVFVYMYMLITSDKISDSWSLLMSQKTEVYRKVPLITLIPSPPPSLQVILTLHHQTETRDKGCKHLKKVLETHHLANLVFVEVVKVCVSHQTVTKRRHIIRIILCMAEETGIRISPCYFKYR